MVAMYFFWLQDKNHAVSSTLDVEHIGGIFILLGVGVVVVIFTALVEFRWTKEKGNLLKR